MLYRQCSFRREAERTFAWTKARGATPSAPVELEALNKDGIWQVEAAVETPREDPSRQAMRELKRPSLSSIMKNIV